ncbi:MAG: radical SAM protein [Candidatus Omnitrophica bacterium]|nr:radical SAM protein [Candidatus Omnitrophota bacterium]
MIGREVRAVCPKCDKNVKGRIYAEGQKVLLEKDCPHCGKTRDLLSTDKKMFMDRMSLLDHPENNSCSIEKCKTGIFNCLDHVARKSPLSFIEVTTRCNMKCPVCYMDAEAKGRDLPLETFKRMVDKVKQEDPETHLILIGGEPTIHENFFELLAYVREKGLMKRTFIATNAIKLADKDFCRKVQEAGIKKFFLAFDGTDREACREIRGSYIAYDALRKALDNIRSNGKAWIILSITAVKDLNLEDVPRSIEFAMDNCDIVKRVMISPEVYCGRVDEKEDLAKNRLTGDFLERYLRDKLNVEVATVSLSLFFALIRPLKSMELIDPQSWVAHMPSPFCGHMGLIWKDHQGRFHSIVDLLVRRPAEKVYEVGRKANEYAAAIKKEEETMKGTSLGELLFRLAVYFFYLPKYFFMLAFHLNFRNLFGLLGALLRAGFNMKKFKKEFFNKRVELFYLLGSDKYNFIWDKMPYCQTPHYRIHPESGEVIKVPGCFVFVFRDHLEGTVVSQKDT